VSVQEYNAVFNNKLSIASMSFLRAHLQNIMFSTSTTVLVAVIRERLESGWWCARSYKHTPIVMHSHVPQYSHPFHKPLTLSHFNFRFRALPSHSDTAARSAALSEVRQAIDRLAAAIGPTHMLCRGALRHLARMMVAANVSL
jgi:hypothetical protein